METAEIVNASVLGHLTEPSSIVGRVESAVRPLQADDTVGQTFEVNGEQSEDPLSKLRWSEARHRIRIATKQYSEDTLPIIESANWRLK